MFLERLIIVSDGKEIRNIHFKMGLNLILDETPQSQSKVSGNNIGKTTLLRVIDFCLGGDSSRIYKDKETGTTNTDIENFLKDKSTKFFLIVKSSQDEQFVIERSLRDRPKINEIEFEKDEDFLKELGRILFLLKKSKPSLRQLMGKFIRIDSYQVENIYKFLHPSTSSKEYEYIFLYLFGFEDQSLLVAKDISLKEIKKLKKQKSVLGKVSPATIKQILKAINDDIKAVEHKLENFELKDSSDSDLKNLESLRGGISSIALEVARLSGGIVASEANLAQLSKTVSSIDSVVIVKIYEEAKLYLKEVNKSFDDLVGFHNNMISNKINFVSRHIEKLASRKQELDVQISILMDDEKKLLKSLDAKGALEDFKKLNLDLANLKELRGQKNSLLAEIKKTQTEINLELENLKKITESINEFKHELDKQLESFNSFFRDIARRFYKENYLFVYEVENNSFEFKVTSIDGAVGTGKKRGQITAFDLAYLKYLEIRKAKTCRFQLNDRLEEVSSTELKSIFDEANSIEGQFIVSILREKVLFLGDEFLKNNNTLSLSQSDKFFKI